MIRDLKPTYPLMHALVAIEKLETYDDLKVLKTVIYDDLDNYTAREFFHISGMLQSKQTSILMQRAKDLQKRKRGPYRAE